MREFSIKSSRSDLTLTLSDLRGDYFMARLNALHLQAARDVYAYTDARGFVNLMADLASHAKPWQGEKSWGSLEGEFAITASCDTLGHVKFNVKMNHTGGAEEWSVETDLFYEFGQLPQLAQSAAAFFGDQQ